MADKENQLHTLWAELKDAFKLNVNYAKFTVAEKLAVLLTTVSLAIIALAFATLILFFLSLAVVWWIAEGVGLKWAYLIMCGFYVAVFACIIAFRKQLIINPISGFISRIFFNP